MLPNQRLHLTPLVGAVAKWTRGTRQGTGSLFQVAFWILVPGFQMIKYVCGAGEPQPLGGADPPVLLSTINSGGQAAMEHYQNPMADAWGLHPTLDMPELFPPAVLFNIQDVDPHTKYKKALEKLTEAKEHGRLQHLPGVPPETIKQWTLRSAWDSIFHEVPGDRVGLLYQQHDSSQKPSSEPYMSYAVLIKSTEPPGKKWIVTRATEFRGKTVCWCIPVEVAQGQRSEVVLNSENMTVLESL